MGRRVTSRMYPLHILPCNVINTRVFFFRVPGPETTPVTLSVLDVLIGRIHETGTVTGKRGAIGAIMMRKEGEVVVEMVKDLTVTGLVKGPVETRTGTVKGTETGVAIAMAIVETGRAKAERPGTVIETVTVTARRETGDESAVMI